MRREDLRDSFPSYGPDWDAAIEYGIDVSLLIHNLELTPGERIAQLQWVSETHEVLSPGRNRDHATDS